MDSTIPPLASASAPVPSKPLRLPGSPASTLAGYLRLEDVLNRVGERDHPGEWGRLPGWTMMPFRWSPSRKRYVRHELGRAGGKARLRTFPIKLDMTKDERHACTRVFRAVKDTVRDALEATTLKAHAVHDATGLVTPITAPAVWRKQVHVIFMTGRTIIRHHGQPDQLADVVIRADDFEPWIAARDEVQEKNASLEALRQAGEIIREHEAARGYTITREAALHLVKAAAANYGRTVTERPFQKQVWGQRKNPPGSPSRDSKARQKEHEAELVDRLDAHFGRTSTA